MKTKTLGAWIAAVMMIAGLSVIGSALFTITQVGGIGETWRNFEHDATTKVMILNELRNAKGLYALDNDFAHIAQRNDSATITNIRKRIGDIRELLTAYEAVGVDDRELTALRTITGVIEIYAAKLVLAETMVREGKSSIVIDAMIHVDGKPALEAVTILDSALNQARMISSTRIYGSVTSVTWLMKSALAISGVIFVLLVAGFYRYLKSRSERNQALRDLAKKTAILEATLNNVHQGISFADSDLNFVAFNQRFLELLEFPLDRFKPGDPFEIFVRYNAERGEYGPGDVETLIKERVDLAKQFKPHHFERERPDGTIIEIHGNVLPNGQGFVTTYTDITDRKRAEQELLKANSRLEQRRLELKQMAQAATEARDSAVAANRTKSEFLANMSHELRTPLNAIIGFSDMMKNQILGPVGNPKYLSYAEDINSSGEHLLGLINDILDISKIEAGEMELHEEPVDITKIVQSSLTLVKARADAGGVILQNDATGPLPALNADARKIKQIVINLLSNAVKFTPTYGTVTIATAIDDDGRFSILVKDTGIGIAPEDIEKVMKPFTQADSALSRVYEGTGLGLPLTKALIEMHQGTFELDSEQGVGTTAVVRFPAGRALGEIHTDDLSAVS